MKKVLISRFCAYGDAIHFSHLPRLLKDQGFDQVDVETNFKGFQLLQNNPFIDNLIFFEPTNNLALYSTSDRIQKHWKIVSKGYDKFINLFETIEKACISSEHDNEYYMHEKNRESYKHINYYNQSTIDAGYPELVDKYKGEVYFTEQEHHIAKRYIDKYDGKFTIMINLNGTTLHKKMIFAPELTQRLIDKYPECRIILTGDKSSSEIADKICSSDNVISVIGRVPFRQAMLMSKYCNLVISMESGFGVGANMWETPTIQLMTAASLENHPNGCKNDFSLQSPAYCSPCNKGPYRFIGCPHKDGYPMCIYFDVDKIMNRVEEAYELTFTKN